MRKGQWFLLVTVPLALVLLAGCVVGGLVAVWLVPTLIRQ